MLLSGKKGVGILLAGILFFSLPMGALAGDSDQMQGMSGEAQEEIITLFTITMTKSTN